MNTEHRYIVIGISLPLLLALIIYLTCGSKTYVSAFFERIISLPVIHYPKIIRNHICDALWSVSLWSSLYLVLRKYKNGIIYTGFVALALGSVLEGLQRFPGISGTFDYLDIAVESFAIVTISVILYLKRREKYEEKID